MVELPLVELVETLRDGYRFGTGGRSSESRSR